MSNIKKRAYRSEARKAQAADTRQRILHSAKKLFQKEGFEAVTIDAIAKAAEISAPTIYALFQSKRGILRELMDEAFPKTQFDSLVEQGQHEKSPKKRLLITAKIARKIYDAEKAQMGIFRGASVLAPEFKELEREREMRRHQRQEEFVAILAKEGALAQGITLAKARDVLWAFSGRDLYRMLVIEQKWSSDEYEKWLGQLLVKALIK
jgi:AcrR family transcriptional regulator